MTLNGKMCTILLIVLGTVNCLRLYLSKSIEEGRFFMSLFTSASPFFGGGGKST